MNNKGKKILAILTSVLMVVNVFVNSHFVYANENVENNNKGMDVSISCDKKDVTPGEWVEFKLEYKAKNGPGSIKPGDTIEFSVPDWLKGFKFSYPREHIKDVKFVKDNEVVATFGDDVKEALAGYITASAYAQKTQEIKNHKVIVKVNGKAIDSVDITIKPSNDLETIYDRELRKTVYRYDYTDSNETNTVGSIYSPVVGKTQAYQIYVNEKYSHIDNATLNDNMPDGMELIPSSLEIVKIERDKTETDVTDKFDINKNKNKLQVEFKNIKDKYVVIYKAKITKDNKTYKNVATLIKPQESLESTVIINNKKEIKDVISKFSYGNSSKRVDGQNVTYSSIGSKVHYRIDINKNSSSLNNVLLQDTTPNGMKLLKGSVKIAKYEKDGSFKWIIENLEDKINIKDGNLEVSLGDIEEYYIVEYDMEIDKVEEEYANTANLSYNGTEKNVKDIVKYDYNSGAINAKKLVDKQTLEKGDNQKVVYTIEFRSFGVFKKGYIDLEDKIDPSVKILKVETPSQFTSYIDKDNNTVRVKNEKGQINYKENIKVKIYTDFSNVEDGTTVKNVATINENKTNEVMTKKGYRFNAQKVDSENENIKLSGAKFELEDSNKKMIKYIESDDNGTIKSAIDKPGTYYIKELKAPQGYILNNQAIKFVINKEDIGKTINIEDIKNEKEKPKEPDKVIPNKEEKTEEPDKVIPNKEEKTEEPDKVVPNKEEKTEEPDKVIPNKEEKTEEPDKVIPKEEEKPKEPDKVVPNKEEKPKEPDKVVPKEEEKPKEPDKVVPKEEEKPKEPDKVVPNKEEKSKEPDKVVPNKEEKPKESDKVVPKEEEKPKEPDKVVPKEEEKPKEPDKVVPKDEEKTEEADKVVPKEEEKTEETDKVVPKEEEKTEEVDKVVPKEEETKESDKVVANKEERMEEANKAVPKVEEKVEEVNKVVPKEEKSIGKNVENVKNDSIDKSTTKKDSNIGSKTEKIQKNYNPKTGEQSATKYIILLLVSIIGIVFINCKNKK